MGYWWSKPEAGSLTPPCLAPLIVENPSIEPEREREPSILVANPDLDPDPPHGWSGISLTSSSFEDWKSLCRESLNTDKDDNKDSHTAELCDKCQEIDALLLICQDPNASDGAYDPKKGIDRAVRVGSGEEIRKRGDVCYCCRSLGWLMERYDVPSEQEVCVHLPTPKSSGAAIRIAFVDPTETFSDGHDSFEHESLRANLIIRPLNAKFGVETQLRTYDPHRVHLGRVRAWMDDCDEFHVEECQSGRRISLEVEGSSPDPLTEILLVDLEKECVVTASYEARYVALSYVWGVAKSVLTTSKNIEALRQPGALSETNATFQLPQTIKDAMSLCRLLGESMIWVDSLCIIQDEGELKQRFLKAMGSIYANAHFTIVAAEGDHADYGIRGIGAGSTDRNVPCCILDFPQSPMMIQEEHIYSSFPEDSKWASRSWTYQELIFSKRLLIMDRLVSWICGRGSYVDEFADQSRKHWGRRIEEISGLHKTAAERANLRDWSQLVRSINVRELTYESDILNSFAAITYVMSPEFAGGIFHGLPAADFEVGLLWQISGHSRRRHALDRNGNPLPLPSWSWVGFAGYLNLNIWAESQVVWEGVERTVVVSPLVEWQTFPEVSNSNTEDEVKNQESISKQSFFGGTEQEPLYTILEHVGIQTESTVAKPALFAEYYAGTNLSTCPPFLHFRTKRALLKLGKEEPPGLTDDENPVLEIIDSEGRTIGAMVLNTEIVEFPRGEKHEFIAVSTSRIKKSPGYDNRSDFVKFEDWGLSSWYRNFGLEVEDKGFFEICNVLWVEWDDGVAYRKGLGRIIKPAWEQLDLKVVDVVLG